MIRTSLVLVALLVLVSGCGSEPERSRFVPSTGEKKATGAVDRKDSKEVSIPYKIEMH